METKKLKGIFYLLLAGIMFVISYNHNGNCNCSGIYISGLITYQGANLLCPLQNNEKMRSVTSIVIIIIGILFIMWHYIGMKHI